MSKLISRAEVLERIGVSYPTIWTWMRAGKFPRSLRLADGEFSRVAWIETEVEEWIASRPRQRLKGDGPLKGKREKLNSHVCIP